MFTLACGKQLTNPFPDALLKEGVSFWSNCLHKRTGLKTDECITPGQPFRLFLLSAFLKEMGDPDYDCLTTGQHSYVQGVHLGVEAPLPRVPAVFEERTHFRSYDDPGIISDKDKYSSAKEHGSELLLQFKEEIELGAMITMDEDDARKIYGDRFLIAALGAIEKGDGSFRVIHDGTHSVGVNPRIKILDQQRCPTAAELCVALRSLPSGRFTLAADIN